jgi:transcriptional regulator with XRE-family HTH domain
MVRLDALGEHINHLRRTSRLSLADLADATGVSVSMLSAIERAEKAPTVVVLARVADGLGMSLAQLLAEIEPTRSVLRRAHEHEVVEEPGAWTRTLLSPVVPGVGFEWIRSTLPPGCDAGTYRGYAPGSHEFVHVESGTLRLTVDEVVHELRPGDTLYFSSDADHAYANPGETDCTYTIAALNARSRKPDARPPVP